MKTEVTHFSVPWTRMLKDVLEYVQVCAHISSKLTNGTCSLWFITQLFRFL